MAVIGRMHDAVSTFGRFDDQTREFVLTNWRPPKPWKNILFNDRFNLQPTQTGAGISYRRDEDGAIILINWSGQQALYVADLETGEYFSVGGPTSSRLAPDAFQSRFGLGYQIVTHRSLGIEVTMTITVPTKGDVALYDVRIENVSGRARRLRVVMLSDLDLNVKDPYHGTRNRFRCSVSEDHRVLDVHNRSHLANRVWQAYFASSLRIDAFSFERESVEGVYGTLAFPERLTGKWGKALTPPDRPAFVAGVELRLASDGKQVWHFAVGCTQNPAEIAEVGKWVEPGRFDSELLQVQRKNAARYAVLTVKTPDADFNRFVNTWLPHQLAYNAYWNRGWGKGVRDGMQDAWAYLLLEPQHVRKMIEAALPHQFADGRTVRKWAPIDSKPYNDGGVWLALAVWAYVSETGDEPFLRHRSPFFQSQEDGTVLEHCYRAMKYLADNRGAHGLCLMPYGDWNDQLTGPGKGGKGESVWTTMAMAAALPRVAELARIAGDVAIMGQCASWRIECEKALQDHGWNGEWFTRAFDDEGKPIGHPTNREGRIYLLPQAWSVIADIATPEQRDKSIAAARDLLLVEHGYQLLAPAYTSFDPAVGQLSATDPGTVENGGNYCHASSFMMNALCKCGKVNEALDIMQRLLPTNPANPPARSRQEPFSVTNCYRGPAAGEATAGRGHFSWRTGTAGWMLRTAVEGILGVRATLEGLEIAGHLPSEWNEASLERQYRGKRITVKYMRTGRPGLSVDGRTVDGHVVPPAQLRDGSIITVEL